jgi:hypothetical protein
VGIAGQIMFFRVDMTTGKQDIDAFKKVLEQENLAKGVNGKRKQEEESIPNICPCVLMLLEMV